MTKNFQEYDLSKQPSNLKKLKQSHKERLKKLKSAVDEDGSVFSIGEEDRIYFRKKDSRQDICLGFILVGERNLLYYKKYEDEANIFQKTQAWSINYTIFEQVDLIIYESLKYSYVIPKVRAEEFGQVFKFSGTEKKIYVPIIYWDKRRILIDPTEQRRRNLFGDTWYELLKDTINSEYMSKIGNWIRHRRTETIVYPDEANVFRALKLTHFKQVKVVVLGQDPYVDGSANGLAFGFKVRTETKNGVTVKKTPKSLDVILKEVERDMYKGFHLDFDESLDDWAEQGVLLLNTILTVERYKTKSHEGLGWQRFVKIILYELIKDENPKVFMLWGNDAQALFQEVFDKISKVDGFDFSKFSFIHLVLKAKHPASDLYSANQFGTTEPNFPNTFGGNAHFSQANSFLVKNKRKPIIW
jgi:uracil-DNA glycosylase